MAIDNATNFDNFTPDQIASAGLTQEEAMELVKRGYVTDPSVASGLFKYSVGKGPSEGQPVEESASAGPSEYMTPMQTDNTVGAPVLSETEQLQLQRDDEISKLEAQLTDRNKAYDAALDNQLAAQGSGNDALQAAINQQNAQISGMRKDMAGFEAERQVANDKAIAQFEATRKEAEEFVKNKKGFWESRTDGQKALAIVAMALGGFIEGFTQGRVKDGASEIIQRHIAQYTQEQELAYDRIKDKQEAAKTLFGMIQQSTNDRFQTKKIMMDLGLSATEKMVQSVATSTEAKQKAAKFVSEIAKAKEDNTKELIEQVKKKTLSPTQMKAEGTDMRFTPPMDDKKAEGFIYGYGTAPGGAAQKKDIEENYIIPTKKAVSSIDRILELSKKGALKAIAEDPEALGEIENLIVGLKAAKRLEVIGSGTQSEPDRILLDSFINNPLQVAELLERDARTRAKFESMARTSLNSLKDKLKYSGMSLEPEMQEFDNKYSKYTNDRTKNPFGLDDKLKGKS